MTTANTLESAPQVSNESRNWATMTHLSGLVGLFGIPSLLGPLAVWLLKKDDPYIVGEAIEAPDGPHCLVRPDDRCSHTDLRRRDVSVSFHHPLCELNTT